MLRIVVDDLVALFAQNLLIFLTCQLFSMSFGFRLASKVLILELLWA